VRKTLMTRGRFESEQRAHVRDLELAHESVCKTRRIEAWSFQTLIK
jgi:two-component sensor histidine kinase